MLKITEIEVEHKHDENHTNCITIQSLGDSIIIRDTHGHISMTEEMLEDLIKALNIFNSQ